MLNANFSRVIPPVSYENPYNHQMTNVEMSLALTDPSMKFNGKIIRRSVTMQFSTKAR